MEPADSGLCHVLRQYPAGLGKAFVRILKQTKMGERPEPCLRQKRAIFEPDLQAFQSLPTGDVWPDAGAVDCFMYLWHNKNLRVPPEWKSSMMAFAKELKSVAWLFSGSL